MRPKLLVRRTYLGMVLLTGLGAVSTLAAQITLTKDTIFCPSWAEAHERTLASLNNGRPPYPVKSQGCIALKRGMKVDLVEQQEGWTEIVVHGKHWFADE